MALKKHTQGFHTLDVALHDIQLAGVLALALHYQLSTYDAAYLWLAAELKAPLATFDEKLGRAAQAHLVGVDLKVSVRQLKPAYRLRQRLGSGDEVVNHCA